MTTSDVDYLLLKENRRLRQEVERLRAIEASRWWRLHPRRRLGRYKPRRSTTAPEPAQLPTRQAPGSAEPAVVSQFRTDVVERGSFSKDWFTSNVVNWEPVMNELEGKSARALEIGSFEGLSACFITWRLADAGVTCIDTFLGSPEHVARGLIPATGLEPVFDANVALVDPHRVHKRVGDSKRVLTDLLAERARFDLVYVDGSHLALDVLVDAALSWQLLADAGYLIFDDQTWAELGEDPLLRPGPAVGAFLSLVGGKYEVVSTGAQMIVRKRLS